MSLSLVQACSPSAVPLRGKTEGRKGLCSSGHSAKQCTNVLLSREQMEHVVFNFYLLISVVVEVPMLALLSHLDKQYILP